MLASVVVRPFGPLFTISAAFRSIGTVGEQKLG
jgi:hypothetical protein